MSNTPKDFIYHSCNDNVLLWIWKERKYYQLPNPVKTIEIGLHELSRFIFDNLPGKEMKIDGERTFWSKKYQESYGIELNFYTLEPPVEGDK